MANAKDKMNTSRRFEDLLQQFHDDDDDFANMHFEFQDTSLKQESDVAMEHVKEGNESKAKMEAVVDEEHLSQKLSQLSTKEEQDNDPPQQDMVTLKKRLSVEPPNNTAKKMKTKHEKLDNEIPKYLSASNKAFDKVFNPLLSKTANTMNIEDIRQVALLCHKMALLDQQKLLWSAYLCSGTGKITFEDQQQVPTISAALSIWPEEVKSTMITKGATSATHETAIDHDACLNFVRKTLRDCKDRFAQYKTQLHEKIDSLPYFTEEIQDVIAQFIEREGLAIAQLQLKMKVAAVEYTYIDRMIEMEFRQLNHNGHQLHVFENLTRAKQEKTTAKYDLAILKQHAIHNHLPESINSSQIPPPLSLHTISDQGSRQHLLNRYTKIIEQAKSDMMSLYIASAEAHMRECDIKFDTELAQMKKDQHSDQSERRMTHAMIKVMERRFKNLNERFQCLQQLKMCIFIKPPPVTLATKQITSGDGANI